MERGNWHGTRDLPCTSAKGITEEQYEAAIQKYPVLGQLYTLLKEFYRIVFSRRSE